MLSLLYLTLALVWIGGLGIFAVTGESLYDAFWQVRFLTTMLLQFPQYPPGPPDLVLVPP